MASRWASRRASRKVIDYTTQWANDLVARSGSPPTSSGSGKTMPAVDEDATLANLAARRCWTRWVCAGTLVLLVVNVASTAFVVIWLRPSARPAEDSFLQQDGSGQVLRNVRYLSTPSNYTKHGLKKGTSIHAVDIPVAMHLVLPSNASRDESQRSDDGKTHVIIGWEANSGYLDKSKVDLDKPTGTLTIGRDGYYQIYSQLTFQPHPNQSHDEVRVYEQQLKDVGNEQILLSDYEAANCVGKGKDIHIPCHASSMFSVLHLQKGTRLQLWARPIYDIARGDKVTFFGVFRLD